MGLWWHISAIMHFSNLYVVDILYKLCRLVTYQRVKQIKIKKCTCIISAILLVSYFSDIKIWQININNQKIDLSDDFVFLLKSYMPTNQMKWYWKNRSRQLTCQILMLFCQIIVSTCHSLLFMWFYLPSCMQITHTRKTMPF